MFHRMAGPYRVLKRNSRAVKRPEIGRAELAALSTERACYVVRPAYGDTFRIGATCRRSGKIPKVAHLLGAGAKRKRRR